MSGLVKANTCSLPVPIAFGQAVVQDSSLHLLSGQRSDKAPNTTVYSSEELADGHRVWNATLPEIPHGACGALSVFSSIIVAGGAETSGLDAPTWHVYFLDGDRGTWLRMPTLGVKRALPTLVRYKTTIACFGGLHPDSKHPRRSGAVEVMHLH